MCCAILLRIPKTRRNTTTTKHAQINAMTHNQWGQHTVVYMSVTADGCFYLISQYRYCSQTAFSYRPCRHSQQPTTHRYATTSQTILILSSCCRLESIKTSSKRKAKWCASWWVCVHIYASAAQRCAGTISTMRLNWVDWLTTYLKMAWRCTWWVIATRSIMMTLWIPNATMMASVDIWYIGQWGTPLTLNNGSIEKDCQCPIGAEDFISRVVEMVAPQLAHHLWRET